MIDDASPPDPATSHGGAAMTRAALWLSIAALVVTAALVIPFIAPRNPAVIPLFVLALAAAVTGIVLSVSARRPPAGGQRARSWALAAAVGALVVDAVLTVIFVVAIIGVTPLAEVELRGTGPQNITVTYSSEIEKVTRQWPSEGHATFNTAGGWAEITITAPGSS